MRSLPLCLFLLATPALAEVPRVVTDIPPVQSLVAQVMGDLGQPDLLLAKGASEHDLQLRPSQARALAGAGLVVWIGPELTPSLSDALAGLGPDTPQLALLDAPETRRRAFSTDEADHDHAHDHGPTDPHAWLDPDNARLWLGLIADRLSRLDPANAATYRANATGAQADIAALDATLSDRLAPVRDRRFVLFHDGYGYFTDHYGLTTLGTIALGDATPPGAARLSALRDAMVRDQATCLFPEAQHDPALAQQLAEGTGLRLGPPLDPVGSAQSPGALAYAGLMTALAAALTTCLSP